MKKTKRKAAKRRLKRLVALYDKVSTNYLIPRYMRETIIKQKEIWL